jgi:pantetheine-phosphate adenylyltransferase
MVRAVVPGTFDPIHRGHMDIILRATNLFEEIIVAVYDRPLKSLLFSPQERIDLVQKSFPDNQHISVMGFSGLTVEFCHSVEAQVIVRGLRVFSDFEYEFRMGLANHRLAPDMVPPHVESALKQRFSELGDGQQIVPTTSMRD